LIADEPTTALDVTIQAQIVDLVKRLQERLGMTVIWITHDLGVVAGLAQRVNVMYAGSIIEAGPVKEIYGNPHHPYTVGLLGSLPRPNEPPGARLYSIRGEPPDLLGATKGCPFAPRCDYRVERCQYEMPPLEEVASKHIVACWEKEKVRKVR
jgi:oligopeptide transport system ATP-binding protein